MKLNIRAALLVLALFIVVEIWFLWLLPEPTVAQSLPLLGRPYYGPAVDHTARFDHQYPRYDNEVLEEPNNPWVPTTIMRDDGVIFTEDCSHPARLNACYSGHDGRDFKLHYKPVVSAADGIVQVAKWHGGANHAFGLGLHIEVEHAGVFRTVYGHLSAIRYQPTTSVGRWQIGVSGNTGNSTGAHLHFGAKIKKPSGAWAITDPWGWNNASMQDPWQARPTGAGSTFLWLPEPARTIAIPPRGETRQIDDFTYPGTLFGCASGNDYWTPVTGLSGSIAVNGNLHFTHSNGTVQDCYAAWGGSAYGYNVKLPGAGLYEVEVRIPRYLVNQRSRAARYIVTFPVGSGVGSNVVVVDQAGFDPDGKLTDGWISLGRYTFNEGPQFAQYVHVVDASFIADYTEISNPPSNPRYILVDAMRLVKAQ